jgi:hypothetical protein
MAGVDSGVGFVCSVLDLGLPGENLLAASIQRTSLLSAKEVAQQKHNVCAARQAAWPEPNGYDILASTGAVWVHSGQNGVEVTTESPHARLGRHAMPNGLPTLLVDH